MEVKSNYSEIAIIIIKRYSKAKVNPRIVQLYETLSLTECQQICISEKGSIFHLVLLAIKTAESFENLIL